MLQWCIGDKLSSPSDNMKINYNKFNELPNMTAAYEITFEINFHKIIVIIVIAAHNKVCFRVRKIRYLHENQHKCSFFSALPVLNFDSVLYILLFQIHVSALKFHRNIQLHFMLSYCGHSPTHNATAKILLWCHFSLPRCDSVITGDTRWLKWEFHKSPQLLWNPCERKGVSVESLENWEQKKTNLEAAAWTKIIYTFF